MRRRWWDPPVRASTRPCFGMHDYRSDEDSGGTTMASRISFGFTIPQRGVLFGIGTWPQMIGLAREVDQSALFDSIWVGDSIMAKPRPDSISLLGALSAATSRVKLGVGCMASFPLRDPIGFALQWATLDLISNGRMLLVVCTGIVPGGASAREGAAWGVKDTARGDRMAEHIEICRRLCFFDIWEDENRFGLCAESLRRFILPIKVPQCGIHTLIDLGRRGSKRALCKYRSTKNQ